MTSSSPRIRPIAIGIIRCKDRILVCEAHDRVKRETFYRALGGGIEFGELGEAALAREFHEELGAEIRNTRYLGMLENIFTFEGKPGHEIVLVYEADFADASLYSSEELIAHEESGAALRVRWMPLDHFSAGAAPLYPTGLLRLLTTAAS